MASNKRARIVPYIVQITIPKPTVVLANAIVVTPKVVTVTIPTPTVVLV